MTLEEIISVARKHVDRTAHCFLALALLLPSPVTAQPYPSKPVRIVVAQAPGGASDLLIRFFEESERGVIK